MELSEALATLRYFNDKVNHLATLQFTKYVTEHTISTPSLLAGERFIEEAVEPGQEAIEAFVLTLRFFIQDNEPISIRNLAALYDQLPVSEEARALVRGTRDQLTVALDSYSPLGIEGRRLRYGEIFDTFLYGWLAHGRDKQERETASRWRAEPRRFAYLRTLFIMSLMDYIETLYWFRAFNEQTLAELSQLSAMPGDA